MKGWQSITIGFNVPSFVHIPNIRKWRLGIEGSIVVQPCPFSLAARFLLAPSGAELGVLPPPLLLASPSRMLILLEFFSLQ